MADKDWLYGFLRRHPDLSLQCPEPINMDRANAFKKDQVHLFFDIYSELVERLNIGPKKIWKLDESGLSTVQRPKKLSATKGVRNVCQATSGERGTNVSAIYAASAVEKLLPLC